MTFQSERLRSRESADVDYIWDREHDLLHRLTQSAEAMLLKTVTQRHETEDETRYRRESRDLMICSLAMDPRFKRFPVQLCALSRSEEYAWFVVKEMAMCHLKFEKHVVLCNLLGSGKSLPFFLNSKNSWTKALL